MPPHVMSNEGNIIEQATATSMQAPLSPSVPTQLLLKTPEHYVAAEKPTSNQPGEAVEEAEAPEQGGGPLVRQRQRR